jgi:hypothetical protein
MGWEILIIPIIGVAVWIISTVIRGAEEAKKSVPPQRKRPEKGDDLDRFREVQRRRRAAERAQERPRRVERDEEIPVVVPVEEVPLARPVVVVPPVIQTVAAVPPEPVTAALPPRPESPALAGLRQMLQSREAVRRAIILQEVLGPPLARRRRPR